MLHPDTLKTVDYGVVLDNMAKFKIEDGWSILTLQRGPESDKTKGRFLGEVRYQTTNLFETPVAQLVPGPARSSSTSEQVASTGSSSSGRRRKKIFKPHPEVVFKKYATVMSWRCRMSEVNLMQADNDITMDAIKKCFDELQINIPEALVCWFLINLLAFVVMRLVVAGGREVQVTGCEQEWRA